MGTVLEDQKKELQQQKNSQGPSKGANDELVKELNQQKTITRTANAHIVSILRAFIHFLKYMLTKCLSYQSSNQFGAATSLSNYSHINPIGGLNRGNAGAGGNQMEGTVFSSSSLTITEHMMEKSFDDDKRNIFEQIKALLLSKLQIIQRTLKGINISKEIENVRNWNYEQLISVPDN